MSGERRSLIGRPDATCTEATADWLSAVDSEYKRPNATLCLQLAWGGLGRQTDRPKLIADYSKSFLKDLPTTSSPFPPHLPTNFLTSSYNFPHLSLHIFLLTSSYNYSVYIFLQISSPLSPHLPIRSDDVDSDLRTYLFCGTSTSGDRLGGPEG